MSAANRGLPVIVGIACIVATVVITLFPSSILGSSRHTPDGIGETLQESGTPLGGLDLHGYCRAKQAGVAVWAEDHWACQQGSERVAIDLTDACRLQHNLPEAVARQQDPSSSYSWTCFR